MGKPFVALPVTPLMIGPNHHFLAQVRKRTPRQSLGEKKAPAGQSPLTKRYLQNLTLDLLTLGIYRTVEKKQNATANNERE